MRFTPVRFTIERLRTILLAAGVLLIIALAVSLAVGRIKNPFKKFDVPKHLGIEIQQEANGVTYRHTFGSHAVFQIHASKVVQLKNNLAKLHDVKIELYETDGSRVDRIEGAEFEYDQQNEVARAAGPVEITMLRPQSVAASPKSAASPNPIPTPNRNPAASVGTGSPVSTAPTIPGNEIHVKTSGLVFYQKTGIATTTQRADFSMNEGSGYSIGATYDSSQGHLVLDRQVEMNVHRNGEPVTLHAEHAEFDRDDMVSNLQRATASYRGGEATAGQAKILFRDDGTAVRIDATDGFTLATANGGHVAAPEGWLEFNDDNQPRHGHMQGGVTLDSTTSSAGGERQSHGSAPTAELDFTENGLLRHAHLERGVELTSDETGTSPADGVHSGPLHSTRTWRSLIADVEFRESALGNQVEPASLHGVGGVAVTGQSQHGSGAVLPSRLASDDMIVHFGPNSTMSDLKGTGHAAMDQTTAAGVRQSSSGDRIEAHFAQPGSAVEAARPKSVNSANGAAQIEAALLDGHVIMDQMPQQPSAKPGEHAASPMHATAGHAEYEGAGEWIHLTIDPRVDDGGLQLAAEKIDISQATGDAFAKGNVKATWLASPDAKPDQPVASQSNQASQGRPAVGIGGHGPSHVVSSEAQLHQATGEATFRGNARLWQDADSVAAPVILLNRQRQTLVATSTDQANPVRVALVSASGNGDLIPNRKPAPNSTSPSSATPNSPSVIRISGGTLKYSDAEHKAVMSAGSLRQVVAETPTARSTSDQVELTLLPPGNHAGKDGNSSQVDKMTAAGHVLVTSGGRRGTGNQLVYTSESAEYVLTGTAAAPPKIVDPAQGEVTGAALIFHSGDDSVIIEGGAGKTVTETRTPK